jgi:restriction system protein
VDIFGSALHILVLAWPIWAIVAAFVSLRLIAYALRRLRLFRAGMNDVDRMTGDEFADCVTYVFEDLGHAVESVRRQEDGALLVVTVDGVRTAVRTEHRTSGRVSSKAVEAVIAAQAKYNCPDAMVVTNQQFTPKARAVAGQNNVVLRNRDDLALMLRAWQEVESERDEETLDIAA